jgi:hypothetical protein
MASAKDITKRKVARHHEKGMMTVKVGGSFHNVRTVFGGKAMSTKSATAKAKKTKKLGKAYKTRKEAVSARISNRPKRPSKLKKSHY